MMWTLYVKPLAVMTAFGQEPRLREAPPLWTWWSRSFNARSWQLYNWWYVCTWHSGWRSYDNELEEGLAGWLIKKDNHLPYQTLLAVRYGIKTGLTHRVCISDYLKVMYYYQDVEENLLVILYTENREARAKQTNQMLNKQTKLVKLAKEGLSRGKRIQSLED